MAGRFYRSTAHHDFSCARQTPGPGHHIFLDSLATPAPGVNTDTQLLFKELGNRINPATGRPFYDLGNNSDNMISLLGAQGGASNVNGALVHANDHDKYSEFIRNKAAPAVVRAYTDARLAGKTHLEALDAAGRVALGYSNSLKMLLLGAYGQSNLVGANGTVAVTGDVRFTGAGDTTEWIELGDGTRVTPNHRYLTPRGTFEPIVDILAGDGLAVAADGDWAQYGADTSSSRFLSGGKVFKATIGTRHAFVQFAG